MALKFDRDAEREADILGLEYSYLSGYDPQAFVSIMERIGESDTKHHGRLEKAFSTHPETAERVAQARHVISLLLPKQDDYVVDSSDFQTARRTLANLQGRIVDADQLPRPQLRHISRLMPISRRGE
jgi:predicted Zn-dependent protease